MGEVLRVAAPVQVVLEGPRGTLIALFWAILPHAPAARSSQGPGPTDGRIEAWIEVAPGETRALLVELTFD